MSTTLVGHTCARCGLPVGKLPTECGADMVWKSDEAESCAIIECRNRQIAAQAALLRSITGKLEEVADDLASRNDDRLRRPLTIINNVLEVLS